MEQLEGSVEHIIYRNEENGYSVFNLQASEGELTCIGSFPYLQEGEFVEVSGEYVNHALYGRQFKVQELIEKQPEDAVEIERYLSSGIIKGIGATLAARIVKMFGDETFRIMEEEPERLAEVRGISEKKAREIGLQMYENRATRQNSLYLQKLGISTKLAAKISAYYGNRTRAVLEENPYQVADHISGIGFRTMDEIAMRKGVSPDSEYRLKSGLVYVLQQSIADGHCFLTKEGLLYRASVLLGQESFDIEKFLMDLAMEKKVVLKPYGETLRVYLSGVYRMELKVAGMLKNLDVDLRADDDEVEERIARIENTTGLELDEMQRQAVMYAAKYGVFILTGGPGTGKTTTINAMIHYFREMRYSVLLAAPTGRAAKRMTEATGCEAQTIHRLLEVSGGPEDSSTSIFARDEDNPLEADVLIIDEMSMVDLPLIHALLSAITPGTHLILVGDASQLPSVGPGSVLKDMIKSEMFPMVMLQHIFRQAGESDIVVNAHKINRGEEVILDNQSKDFFFLKRQDPNIVIRVMLALIQEKLPGYVDASPSEIQVLTPTRKGALGVERLNAVLQQYLNPPSAHKAEKTVGERVFREGDKVMQIRNNYQLEWEITTKRGLVVDSGSGIFNGDMGVITEINPYSETVEVEFDEKRRVKYSYDLLEELEHAYAITIHKAQGSEYPAVVIPLLAGPRQLYHRNLIYTAVTRARKCVTIVGSEVVFGEMVRNVNEQNRNTSLCDRIREMYES